MAGCTHYISLILEGIRRYVRAIQGKGYSPVSVNDTVPPPDAPR